jgi:hypothetical protein
LAYDQSNDPQRGRENKQSLAKIQHSKAQKSGRAVKEKDEAPLVADPRNRLAGGKTDPATKERKPKGA